MLLQQITMFLNHCWTLIAFEIVITDLVFRYIFELICFENIEKILLDEVETTKQLSDLFITSSNSSCKLATNIILHELNLSHDTLFASICH